MKQSCLDSSTTIPSTYSECLSPMCSFIISLILDCFCFLYTKSELGQVRLGFRCRVGWDENGRVGSKGLELTGMMCKSEQLHIHEMSQIVAIF
jgi:hypothetical protein